MKEKKPTTQSRDQWDPWVQPTYRTGGTQPPKSHGGLIAFLLVVIIFLCGISTALGLMNIRLFQQLTTISHEETSPVVFSPSPAATAELPDAPLGFVGQEISAFWQRYHKLPQGIYVTEVLEGSDASKQGVLPGDILVAINNTPISTPTELQELLSSYSVGARIAAEFVRQDQTISLTLILE